MAEGWLVQRFSEFFVEVQKQREAISAGRWAFLADDPVEFDPENPGERGPNPVWEALFQILRSQAYQARESGVCGDQVYAEAQFAMAALADEIFGNKIGDWPGREAWAGYPLQRALFGTRNAGEEMFSKIDDLLRRGVTGGRDLAEIYFNVLTLGFRGRYAVIGRRRGSIDRIPPEIAEYARQLAQLARGGATARSSEVSPRAYEHTDTRRKGDLIPSATQSFVLLAAVIVSLFVVTWFTRSWIESNYAETVRQIESRTGMTGGDR